MKTALPPWLLRLHQGRARTDADTARDQAFLDGVLGSLEEESPRVCIELGRTDPVCLPSLALPGGGRIAMPPPADGGGGLRCFRLLHEAAHCLVHAQRAPFVCAAVDAEIASDLNEWVLAPLHQSASRDAFAERWADAWAALAVRRIGPEEEARALIGRVAAERALARSRPDAAEWSFVHDTSSVLQSTLDVPLADLTDGSALRGLASRLASHAWWNDCACDPFAREALARARETFSPEPWLREHTLDARRNASQGHDRLAVLMKGHPLLPLLEAPVPLPMPGSRDVAECSFDALVSRARPLPAARSALMDTADWHTAQSLRVAPSSPSPGLRAPVN